MRFDKLIYLVSTNEVVNDSGDTIIVPTDRRKTFAEEKSVRQSEFYQASAAGFKPEITFEIWTREYRQEQMLEYNGITYKIIRTFKNGELTELICEGMVNHANA